MRLYHFRLVNPRGELVALHEHECLHDGAAATKARELCVNQDVQVWDGRRWVTTIKEHSTSQ